MVNLCEFVFLDMGHRPLICYIRLLKLPFLGVPGYTFSDQVAHPPSSGSGGRFRKPSQFAEVAAQNFLISTSLKKAFHEMFVSHIFGMIGEVVVKQNP